MCSEGIAASWLACEASAPVCQEPNAWVAATTSVKPVEHPRRRHRIAPEHDEPDHVDQHERVAQRPIQIRPPPPQPAQQPERDDEVRVVVVVRQDQPERVVPGEPAIERQLRIEVQRALEVQHAARVARARRAARSGARFVIASYTQQQPDDHQQLDPPARARAAARRRRQRPAVRRCAAGAGRATAVDETCAADKRLESVDTASRQRLRDRPRQGATAADRARRASRARAAAPRGAPPGAGAE